MGVMFDGLPLSPRSGAELRVLLIARISTFQQDRLSLDDQAALCKRYVHDRYPGSVSFTLVSGQGSGEWLDRQDLARAEAEVESCRYDLVVVEDLGRVCRRNRAVDFCEMCEDADTRLIALNDSIDTSREGWRLNAFFAALKHESGNKDTSLRIRRTQRNRFALGGVVQTLPYGYVKPDGAKSAADVSKDPAAQAVYDRVFTMLEEGASYSEVADWMNDEAVPTGRWARKDRWDGRMVRRVVHNPLLKGVRVRNERVSRRVNRTGRRRSVRAAPSERLEHRAPHLAFIDPERYDRVCAALRVKNAGFARGRLAKSADCRKGVPKKGTKWPGQHVICGVCGRPVYWGGHGVREHMMCSGCRDHRCWNAASFDGADAARRISRAILSAIEALPEFDGSFLARVQGKLSARRSARGAESAGAEAQLQDVEAQRSRVAQAIAKGGEEDVLLELLDTLTARRDELSVVLIDLRRDQPVVCELPTLAAIRAEAREAVSEAAADTPEFGRLMRQLVPTLTVYPYRLIDGGAVVLRARLTLDLTQLKCLAQAGLGGEPLLRRELAVDLFDPPERAAYRERVVAGRAQGKAQRQVAAELGITVTAAQRAAALDRMMQERGLADPYVLVTDPEQGSTKWRRHKHPRYRFAPLAEGLAQ